MQVEQAVKKTYVECSHRVLGQQAYWTGMHEIQILDDDAGLDDLALLVQQQGKLAKQPAPYSLFGVVRRIRSKTAKFEGCVVLMQRYQHFLRVRGKGMAIVG
jgi:hypothetical protein